MGSVALLRNLSEQLLHLRDERRRLDVQRASELAQGRQSGLADAALDLADEGSVDIRTERESFLGNTGCYALFSQHSTESC
jgi:hypothetical protein